LTRIRRMDRWHEGGAGFVTYPGVDSEAASGAVEWASGS
jgi:hypothetical protein